MEKSKNSFKEIVFIQLAVLIIVASGVVYWDINQLRSQVTDAQNDIYQKEREAKKNNKVLQRRLKKLQNKMSRLGIGRERPVVQRTYVDPAKIIKTISDAQGLPISFQQWDMVSFHPSFNMRLSIIVPAVTRKKARKQLQDYLTKVEQKLGYKTKQKIQYNKTDILQKKSYYNFIAKVEFLEK